MSGIRLNGRAYGGVATVSDADHLMCEDGSGNIISAQTMIQNILGNMASIEQSDTASKAYSVGDYLVLNGYLYKVTTAIAINNTITPGTNVVKTTVGEEMAHKVLRWSSCAIANTNGTSGTLATITDPRITADHFLDKFTILDELNRVIIGDVSYTITDGQAVLTGISIRSSTAEITLVKEDF